jgi:hypothetical protein
MNITCPKCGAPLQPVALGPETAPWLCAGCSRGFFAAELTPEARAVYRPEHDDWGFTTRAPIEAAVMLEISDAHDRGTSLREDQFVHTSTEILQGLANRKLSASFKVLLVTHISNLGGQ